MTPNEMLVLYEFNSWANRRMLGAVEAVKPEEFLRPMGSSFGSLRDTAAHIYGGEWVWLERFQGRSPASLPGGAEFQDVASLRGRWTALEGRLLGFVGSLAGDDFDRVMGYNTLKIVVYRHTVWPSMQ